MNAHQNHAQIAATNDPFVRSVLQRMAEQQKQAGERFARLRDQRGFTQESLARESGVAHRTIQAWEGGEVLNPRPANIKAVAKALRITPQHLRAVLTPSDGDVSSDVFARLDALEQTVHELREALTKDG